MNPEDAAILASLDAMAKQIEALRAQVMARASAPPVDAPDQLVGHRESGIEKTTWNRACRDGSLRAVKVGKTYKATRANVAAWIESLPSAGVEDERSALTELPADPFEAARARARARTAA